MKFGLNFVNDNRSGVQRFKGWRTTNIGRFENIGAWQFSRRYTLRGYAPVKKTEFGRDFGY
jgi:hypothetical protein